MSQLSVFCFRKQTTLKRLKLKKILIWKYLFYVQITDVFQLLKTGWCHTFTQKSRKELKEDYRSVSILATLLKAFERIMFGNISAFFVNVFWKYQWRFRKGYNTQYCNFQMLEKLKEHVAKGKVFGALLTDLSLAFHCLDHELLTDILNARSFNFPALFLIHD